MHAAAPVSDNPTLHPAERRPCRCSNPPSQPAPLHASSSPPAQLASHALHEGPIHCLELHERSGLLATAGGDGCIRLWRLPQLLRCASGRHAAAQAACWAGHGGSVAACAFTSCGGFLASAGTDGTVQLWRVAAREPLAVLQLSAASLAFAAGDDAALLVAPSSLGLHSTQASPMLLDLSGIPACKLYCSQLAAAQQGSSMLQRPVRAAAAVDPAVAVWLPSSGDSPPRPSTARQGAAAGTGITVQPQHGNVTPGSGGSTEVARRQVGSLATFGRRRQEERQAPAAAAVHEAPGSGSSWLPPDDTPVRPPPAAGRVGLGLFASPLPPSPLSPRADGAVPDAAIAAVYEAPPASSSSVWDPASQSYVVAQGGHAAPVCAILPLPTGLHVLTADGAGVAKLWAASGSGGGGSDGASGSGGVWCTLLPAAADRGQAGCGQRCRPRVTPDGRHVVCGTPSGHVACWDVEQLQGQAHPSADRRHGNAAAAWDLAGQEGGASGRSAPAATAVAWDARSCLLAAGDMAGHLALRWL